MFKLARKYTKFYRAPAEKCSVLSLLSLTLGMSVDVRAEIEPGSDNPLLAYNTAFIQGLGQPENLKQFIEGGSVLPGTYRVDIYVNRSLSGRQDVVFEAGNDGEIKPCLTVLMLRNLGVDIESLMRQDLLSQDVLPGTCIDLKKIIPQAGIEYEANLLRLNINLPQAAMARASRGYVDPELWDEGVTALFTNYSVSANRYQNVGGRKDSLFLSMRNGFNIGPWRVRNESSYTDNSMGQAMFTNNRNYFQRDITSLKSQLTLGEIYSNSDIFDSVRFRGVQLDSDLAMLPDSERGYAPIVRGIANSNATVEVKQNGFVLYRTSVSAGPFELTDIYPSGSNGDLEIIITEADGEVRRFTQAFAALPIMTRKGGYRYSLDIGQYDDLREDSDTPIFGTGNLIFGLTDNVTTFAGLITSGGYNAANGGLGLNTPIGAFSIDATESRSQTRVGSNSGQSVRFLYSKTIADSSTTFTLAGYRYSTEGYRTLMEHVEDDSKVSNSLTRGRARSKLNLSINQSLGKEFGSLYLSATDQNYWNLGGRTRSYQAGYNAYWKSVNYSINLTHTISVDDSSYSYASYSDLRRSDTMVAVSVSFPLGGGSSGPRASFNASRDSSGSNAQANLYGEMPGQDDVNYSVGVNRDALGGYSGDGQINARTQFADVGAGYSQGRDYKAYNMSARGVIVAHEGGVNFGQPVGETFTLAEVENTPGIQVGSYVGVKTASNGYAIVSNAQPYRANWINLNTEDIGPDIELESTTQQVVPRRGAVTKVKFGSKSGQRLEARFLMENGEKVPFGAVVENDLGQQLAVVDPRQTALMLLEHPVGVLLLKWGNNHCSVSYSLEPNAPNENYQSKTLICK